MADLHERPLTGHDLEWPTAKARVRRDPGSGLWHWEHQCAHRLPGRPFHGHPTAFWADAQALADFHARLCTA